MDKESIAPDWDFITCPNCSESFYWDTIYDIWLYGNIGDETFFVPCDCCGVNVLMEPLIYTYETNFRIVNAIEKEKGDK